MKLKNSQITERRTQTNEYIIHAMAFKGSTLAIAAGNLITFVTVSNGRLEPSYQVKNIC